MLPLLLTRATFSNNHFSALEADWSRQMASSPEDAPTEYYSPMMAHARGIADECPVDTRYGIYVLLQPGQDDQIVSYEGLVHINHAFPRTASATLRLTWNLVAPRYQFEDGIASAFARVGTAFLTGAIRIAQTEMPSREIKMYLGNAVDREFASIAASFMQHDHPEYAFAIRGGWLHIGL